MITPPDMVIFDCDGVLVDSEPITNRVIQESLAAHGLPLEIYEIMHLFVGGTMLYFKAFLEGLAAMPEADPAIRAALADVRQENQEGS